MGLLDTFTSRNEALFKSGGLSGFKDFKHDFFGGGGGDPSHEASDIFAQLTRDQWSDYLKNTVPYENKLIDFSNSTTAATDAMSRAGTDVNSAFDRQAGATTDRLKGLGLSLNADEQHAADRSTSLARSLTDVQAQNNAGLQTRELQQSLLGNPTPNIGSLK